MDIKNNYPNRMSKPGSSLAITAMAFGIGSIVSAVMMTLYFPFVLGSLAIVFALLSKGLSPRMGAPARTGIICGFAGLAVNISILVTSVSFVFSNPDLLIEAAQSYDNTIEQMYGAPAEDILGDSMEKMVNDMLEAFQ